MTAVAARYQCTTTMTLTTATTTTTTITSNINYWHQQHHWHYTIVTMFLYKKQKAKEREREREKLLLFKSFYNAYSYICMVVLQYWCGCIGGIGITKVYGLGRWKRERERAERVERVKCKQQLPAVHLNIRYKSRHWDTGRSSL